jgi:hypothetical protein
MSCRRQVLVRLARMAAVRPPRGLPTNRQFFRLWKSRHNRRNYLFAGSDSGGERAAVFYSLIESPKLNALDPEPYLRHVLSRIADHPIARIQELLPWNVVANLSSANQAAA